MSIRIDREKCAKCGQCRAVCPGNLIKRDETGAAYLKHPEECWGCASCLKACRFGAVSYFLGADIGGMGSHMRVEYDGALCHWRIERAGQPPMTITVDRRDANKY